MNFSMQVRFFFCILISVIISVYISHAISSTPNQRSNTSGGEHNAIISSIRKERPGNFLFKIESFSLLQKALKGDKYESCHFQAGGYDWKLSLYPKGNTERGGGGYISLYLVLADPKSVPQEDGVVVFLKFFVFDYVRDTYLVLQDGKDRRFHVMNTEWGLAKLLPRNIFNDPSQGYLVNDTCVFGVEMFFHNEERKAGSSSLSIKNDLGFYERTHFWRIHGFSMLPAVYKSGWFSIGGQKWTLLLYPRGECRNNYQSAGLYLEVHDHSSLPRGWNIYAEYKLSIWDQLYRNYYEIQVAGNWFNADTPNWGYPEFIRLSYLNCASRGFIVGDSAIISVTFTGTIISNTLA